MTPLGNAAAGAETLLPVTPGTTIDEIVARIAAVNSSRVELLVPNGTRELQSLAGCETLKRAAADIGKQVTIFSSDEKTTAAARIAGLDVVPVGGPIAGPDAASARPPAPLPPQAAPPEPTNGSRRIRPTPHFTAPQSPRPHSSSAPARPNSGQTREVPGRKPAPAAPGAQAPRHSGAGPSRTDQDFLASLEAFDRAQTDPAQSRGETVPTAEGALLFDTAGDVGIPRRVSQEHEAWDSAFEAMGETMASEPVTPRPARARPRRTAGAPQEGAAAGGRGLGSLAPLFSRRPRSTTKAAGGNAALAQRPGRSPADGGASAGPARRLPIWPLALLGLVIIGVSGWLLLRSLNLGPTRAVVELTPAVPLAEARPFEDITIPIRGEPVTDPSALDVEGAIVEQPVSALVQGQAISSTLTPIGRASGALFLRNTLSQPVLLQAGTVVPAANGTRFVVDEDATVSAAVATADGITFGRGEATLTATVPGAAGNIPPGSITSIPGFEGTLRVEQGEFTGGTDQEVRVVRTEDVNRVLPDALSRLYGAGQQALQLRLADRPNLQLAQTAITPTLESLQQLQGVEYGVFPPIGGVTPDGTFELETRATFRGLAEPANAPIGQQLQRAVRNQLVNTGQIEPNAQVEVTNWTVGGQGLMVDAAVSPSGETPPLAEAFMEEVQTAIAGRPRAEALNYLQSLVDDRRIASFSPLPDEWETVPARVDVTQATP